LAGCQSNNAETAWQLIQQQQQEQALMRQREDEAENRRKPAEPEMMLSMIAESQRQERYFASLAYIEAFQQKFGNDLRAAPPRAPRRRARPAIRSARRATGTWPRSWHCARP
ncbi:hypothetical protein, partial [Xylella fastidiosa]|uniref:hypothetical protein n=1 Tax=Xylella fastidiosa TaxID=2371 RepID=UPI0019310F7C